MFWGECLQQLLLQFCYAFSIYSMQSFFQDVENVSISDSFVTFSDVEKVLTLHVMLM